MRLMTETKNNQNSARDTSNTHRREYMKWRRICCVCVCARDGKRRHRTTKTNERRTRIRRKHHEGNNRSKRCAEKTQQQQQRQHRDNLAKKIEKNAYTKIPKAIVRARAQLRIYTNEHTHTHTSAPAFSISPKVSNKLPK